MRARPLIVTHHAPDLDAVTSVWILKRFVAQRFADAFVAFVNPGERITDAAREHYGSSPDQTVHVDTGLGRFDHHQPERAIKHICAASLVYEHACEVHPDLKTDRALREIVTFATQIDHFGEIEWPEPDHLRYSFMLHELIRGREFTHPHDDESQLNFGIQCLEAAYAVLNQKIKADAIIEESGQAFMLPAGKCLAVETSNDDTLKEAQKQGFVLVVRKDPKAGNIRIKARPDAPIILAELHQRIIDEDGQGTWFYHGSGKMLINGSRKHQNQTPSPLTLDRVVTIIQEVLGESA